MSQVADLATFDSHSIKRQKSEIVGILTHAGFVLDIDSITYRTSVQKFEIKWLQDPLKRPYDHKINLAVSAIKQALEPHLFTITSDHDNDHSYMFAVKITKRDLVAEAKAAEAEALQKLEDERAAELFEEERARCARMWAGRNFGPCDSNDLRTITWITLADYMHYQRILTALPYRFVLPDGEVLGAYVPHDSKRQGWAKVVLASGLHYLPNKEIDLFCDDRIGMIFEPKLINRTHVEFWSFSARFDYRVEFKYWFEQESRDGKRFLTDREWATVYCRTKYERLEDRTVVYKPVVEVNWAAWGSQEAEAAALFAEKLTSVSHLAVTLQRYYSDTIIRRE